MAMKFDYIMLSNMDEIQITMEMITFKQMC